MSDFNLVEPRGWEYDLQSVYSAYLGYFQLHGVPWFERSWGVLFETFEEFLSFSWPVITVTDADTGRAHIVTRMTSIGAFIKMIKTRFGESLPLVDNIQRVRPFETSQRHLRTITDYTSYKKLHSSLPAVALTALKARVRAGEPKAIRDLWESRDKTFLALDFEWSERNQSTCLEWGYAAARCGHLDAVGIWPPEPEPNYRRGHYIISEYVDRLHNKYRPNFPWAYAFGDSQQIPKAKSPQILQAILSSMGSPDTETIPNTLVLVGHGISGDLNMIEQMKIKIPHNVLVIDVATYERALFNAGARGAMHDPSGQPRASSSTLSLTNLLTSLGVDIQCQMHNSGNDAYMALLGLQLLLDPQNTKVPSIRGRVMHPGIMAPFLAGNRNSGPGVPKISASASMPGMSPFGMLSPMPNMSSVGFSSTGSPSPDPENAVSPLFNGFVASPISGAQPQILNGRHKAGSGMVPTLNAIRQVDGRRAVPNDEVTSKLSSLRLG